MLIENENVNIQSSHNKFQGHSPQIFLNTPSSTTANKPPSDTNQASTATHNSNHHNRNDSTRKVNNNRTDMSNLQENNSLNKESTKNKLKFKPKKKTNAIVAPSNDLKRPEQPEEIAHEIANLASSIKSKKNKVVISGLIN